MLQGACWLYSEVLCAAALIDLQTSVAGLASPRELGVRLSPNKADWGCAECRFEHSNSLHAQQMGLFQEVAATAQCSRAQGIAGSGRRRESTVWGPPQLQR